MKSLLLPSAWKWAGLTLLLAGIVFSALYLFFDFNFSVPVFAVVSSFLETKTFVTFPTSFGDELCIILLLAGLALLIFSKEKNESEQLNLIRYRALLKALIANTIILGFSVLFVYGTPFLGLLVINLFSFQLIYLLFFYAAKLKKDI